MTDQQNPNEKLVNKKLLLVDDEEFILKTLTRILAHEGYEIYTASNADVALELLSRYQFQIIISDQRMPNMTGAELLTQVKEKYPDVIRILLSGFTDFEAMKEAINEGSIYKFISKPWEGALIRDEIKQAFMEYEKQKEAPKKVIDPKKVELELEINRAIQQKEFLVYYQPVMDLAINKMIGVEALIRWQHPKRGILLPNEFLSVCESTGQIEIIGAWALEKACHDIGTLNKKSNHSSPYSVAVNISPRQFNQGLFSLVSNILKNTHFPPNLLILEITENLVMKDNPLCLNILNSFRELGVQLALDDFGIGYSSLSYLKKFPFNIIKIDKSFIHSMNDTNEDLNLVKAIIAMGQALGLLIIAEGIENKDQLKKLKSLDVHYAQGYLLGRPKPLAELDDEQ